MQQYLSAKLNLKPATLAALIQCLAFFAAFFSSWAMYWLASITFDADLSFPIVVLVMLQACFAVYFSYLAGMARWWRWIHLCFPIAVWLMSNLHIPSEVYLIGFIITLSWYWTTFRTQVPFYPSRRNIWQQVARLMPTDRPVRMIDIGSGLGDMSMYIAKELPNSIVEGIEIAPLPWAISLIRGKLRRSTAVFKLGDYHELNFADYDLIFAYLSPAAMQALWLKSCAEMRAGSLLVSYEFEIQGVVPTQIIPDDKREKMLYVWKLD